MPYYFIKYISGMPQKIEVMSSYETFDNKIICMDKQRNIYEVHKNEIFFEK